MVEHKALSKSKYLLGQFFSFKIEMEENLKGAIKSHHMFILSYVTFNSLFYDANDLLHRAALISEFTFSFHLPGQPHVQSHVSGKEN